MSSLLTLPYGSDDDVDDDDEVDYNTEITNSAESHHQSIHSYYRSKRKNSSTNVSLGSPSLPRKSVNTNKTTTSSTTHFEINCSPTPVVRRQKSYYEQTRMRRKQYQNQQPGAQRQGRRKTDRPHTSGMAPAPANHNIKTALHQQLHHPPPSSLLPKFDESTTNSSRMHLETNRYQNKVSDDDGDGDSDDDNSSCCTLPDSTISMHDYYNVHNNDADDTTVATSNMGSANLEINSTSNVTSASHSSTAPSISSSVSRGEEMISSRMKKYGLVNIHEMKRKQQRRRLNRSNSHRSCGLKHNNSSVSSGLTEGTNETSGTEGLFDIPTKIRTAPLHVQMAVEEIHRWLFTEGGHFEDVKTLMTQYSIYVREHFGIPLDRMFCGGIGLHPKLTAYIWQWEVNEEFVFKEIPTHIFERRNEIFSPDEPFCVLEQGRADHIRIRDTDSYIPPDTSKWFRAGKYKDYFALPDIHKGVSKGGLAWSTKCPDGFCDDDIQFFRMTHAALTTIMRLHTNDLVLNTLTDRMESEIKDRTNELAITNRKLEEANQEISCHASKQLEHFACMSHEIRTPLNCIVGLTTLLLESEDLNEELMDTIRMVYNSADLVQGVVNDVLDYAKIESGHFELDVRPNDLQTTLNSVVHSISNKVQDKNVEVRTSYCANLGPMMTTDSRRLQQILYNILGNAAKFSREGTTIDFKVQVVAAASDNDSSGSNQHKIRFSVKDYGKGIEEKNFEKIFQPFSQASKETQTIYGGTGLGLSITKNLVARLGGTIAIKSEIDKFTEFIVDLPYHEELVNGATHKEKLSEASIVILDPSERPPNAPPLEQDSFIPFPTDVIQHYNLNVVRCSSWGELENKLRQQANVQGNYVFIAHEDIVERQGVLDVEKIVARERCAWLTFGTDKSSHHQRQYHLKTLTGIFPSALLEKISEAMAVQRISTSTDRHFVESPSRMNEEKADQQQEALALEQSRRGLFPMTETNNSGNPLSSTKPKKKFIAKYPPRALKVLIVDDNTINQKVLQRILVRLGVADIEIVNNGKKAVDLTETTQFDCIFMDMEMPVMGGLEACKLIVERDKDSSRVVFVTAHDIEDIRVKADEAGAYGYITKPLKMQDIHDFLKTLEALKKKPVHEFPKVKDKSSSKTSEGSSPIASQKKRSTPPKKYPPRNLKILVAEDNLINQKVLIRILKHLGVLDVTVVDNGEKAVNASESTTFDCILMDMQMPIMDGLEACKIIIERDKEKGHCPKIVFVTAHALVEFKEKALAAGSFDFVSKPFKMEDIENLLKILEAAKSKPLASSGRASHGNELELFPSPASSPDHSSEESKPKKMPKLAHAVSRD